MQCFLENKHDKKHDKDLVQMCSRHVNASYLFRVFFHVSATQAWINYVPFVEKERQTITQTRVLKALRFEVHQKKTPTKKWEMADHIWVPIKFCPELP